MATPSYSLHQCDCREGLKTLPENSVDFVLTDPPYGLSKEPDIAEVMRHWLAGDVYEHGSSGFMGANWDSFVPGPEYWREVYRVMKPGAYLMACCGTRTWDLLSIAIRFAGFENRDTIRLDGPPALGWTYATGFPKSHDVGKALDAMAGAEREVVGVHSQSGAKFKTTQAIIDNGGFNDPSRTSYATTAPATDAAKEWDGWGTALKPAWEVVLVFRKPLYEKSVAANVLKWGTGALNIEAGRIGTTGGETHSKKAPNQIYGVYGALTGTKQNGGRWPSNFILQHPPDCEPDGEGYRCAGGCPVRLLGEQSGVSKSTGGSGPASKNWRGDGYTCGVGFGSGGGGLGDTGTAARFFLNLEPEAPFLYCAKPSRSERDRGCEGFEEKQWVQWQTGNGASGGASSMSAGRDTKRRNVHPTVKPINLCRYLIKLACRPGATVLDLFMGSGSVGCAAMLEGMRFIGFEMEPEYFDIAQARVSYAAAEQCGTAWELEQEPAPKPATAPALKVPQMALALE